MAGLAPHRLPPGHTLAALQPVTWAPAIQAQIVDHKHAFQISCGDRVQCPDRGVTDGSTIFGIACPRCDWTGWICVEHPSSPFHHDGWPACCIRCPGCHTPLVWTVRQALRTSVTKSRASTSPGGTSEPAQALAERYSVADRAHFQVSTAETARPPVVVLRPHRGSGVLCRTGDSETRTPRAPIGEKAQRTALTVRARSESLLPTITPS